MAFLNESIYLLKISKTYILKNAIMPSDSITNSGRKVILQEAEALLKLGNELPNSFATIVKLILNTKGRVIVSGVGKSGHIGRKISATFVSTGTSSFFVHATEASHGDLGLFTSDDVCLLISNSGETRELQDIIAHTLRFSIPLVAISSGKESMLMKAANYHLLLPNSPEACPMGMAPTTSTTLTLALGDALAVALMRERNFQPEHFREFHPGGRLGAQLACVSQLMHKDEAMPLVNFDKMMEDALLEMSSKGFGSTGVVQDNFLFGVISDGDLRRNMNELMSRSAGEVASTSPITVPPDMPAPEALALMYKGKVTVLFVVDATGKPLGILHIHDLLRFGII
jgi:arabinose-5-phosphate isomerase